MVSQSIAGLETNHSIYIPLFPYKWCLSKTHDDDDDEIDDDEDD